MSQIPAGTQPTFGADEPFYEQRTSVLAIVSLVLGIVSLVCCFIPFVPIGVGLVAIILAISAMVFIGGSQGRLAGRGLAVGGLITGVIALVINVMGLVILSRGAGMFMKFMNGPAGQAMSQIEQGNYTQARANLAAPAQSLVTDADFDRFKAAYQGSVGKYQRMPQGLLEVFEGYAQSFGGLQGKNTSIQTKVQGRNDLIPLPGKFEKGMALVFVQFDPASNQGSLDKLAPLNLTVVLPDGKIVSLYEPASPFKSPGGGNAVPPAPPDQPAPDQPKDAPKAVEPPAPPAPKSGG